MSKKSSKPKQQNLRFEAVEKNEYQIYSVRDTKSQVFFQPKYFRNQAEAQRFLHDLTNSPGSDNLIHKYPEDYDLFHLGSYDQLSGQITSIVPTHVVKALTLKQ